MSDEAGQLGLTAEQAEQLLQLRNEYQNYIGYDASHPTAWFGNQLSTYLTSLCIDAAIANEDYKTQPSTYLRRGILQEFENYLGRPPQAEDLLHELARVVTVPEFVDAVLRRDMARLRTDG